MTDKKWAEGRVQVNLWLTRESSRKREEMNRSEYIRDAIELAIQCRDDYHETVGE